MHISINISLNSKTSDYELLRRLEILDGLQDGSVVTFNFHLDTFVLPHQLLFIISKIRSIDDRPIQKKGVFNFYGESANYASRMNFFDLLNVTYSENFRRNPPDDNFIELTNFSGEDAYKITPKIIRMLKRHTRINNSVLIGLDYCLGEVLDNVDAHSESKNGGWVVAQYYPRLNSIQLMVCDTGIGIQKSLSKAEKYKDISHTDALLKCIEPRVTDGKGLGMGLYFTHKFITENRGLLTIFSGENKLILKDQRINIGHGATWNGTALFFEIKTNIDVDMNVIADGYTDFVDTFHERYATEGDFDLW